MKCQAGFTLIEIMLAVAILAIISAIAIPAYQGYIAEARIGTVIKDIRQMELVLNDLAMDFDLASLDGNVTTPRGVYLVAGQITLGDTATAPAGGQAWEDPWGQIYLYRRPGVLVDGGGDLSNDSALPQGYDLYSFGADGSDSTENIVRGCNGEFVGVQSDHPTC